MGAAVAPFPNMVGDSRLMQSRKMVKVSGTQLEVVPMVPSPTVGLWLRFPRSQLEGQLFLFPTLRPEEFRFLPTMH